MRGVINEDMSDAPDDRESQETDDWPPEPTQHPVIKHLLRWCANGWERSVKPYAIRIATETAGIVILGGVLGAAWVGIPSEMFAQVMAQGNHTLDQPWRDLLAGAMKVGGFIGIGWAGVAIIYGQVRDERKLTQLFAHRPLKTLFHVLLKMQEGSGLSKF